MNIPKEPHVIIAGAGPGGLMAAKRLQQQGIKVTVIEKRSYAKICSDVGGFYELSRNTVQLLEEFGLKNEYSAVQQPAKRVHFMREDGTLIRTWTLADDYPVSVVRRSDIQRILLQAVGEEHVLCGSGFQTVQQSMEGVEVMLENGQTLQGDVLIGADGIHSRVLADVFPGESQLQQLQMHCYWGFCDLEQARNLYGPEATPFPFEAGDTFSIQGQGSVLAIIAGKDGICAWVGFVRTAANNTTAANTVPSSTTPILQLQHKQNTDLSPEEIKEAALQIFEPSDSPSSPSIGWVRELIRRTLTQGIVRKDIPDREPLPCWHSGRVVLLGDAAHPMSPFIGQGANMAMIDGYLLGSLLGRVFLQEKENQEALLRTGAEKYEALKAAFVEFQSLRYEPARINMRRGRQGGELVLSVHWLRKFLYRAMLRFIPLSWLAKMTQAADRVNDPALVACGVKPMTLL